MIKFLNSYRRKPKYFKKIEELSKTGGVSPQILVKSDKRLLSGDDLCKDCRDYSGGVGNHTSVDGLYFYFDDEQFYLLLIEFKCIKKEMTEEEIKELKLNLKLKSLETIYCILPHLIENHPEKETISEELRKFPKAYLFVTNYEDKTRGHRDFLGDYYDLKRLSPYPFDQIETFTVEEFESFLTDFFH